MARKSLVPAGYPALLARVKERVRTAQIKAALSAGIPHHDRPVRPQLVANAGVLPCVCVESKTVAACDRIRLPTASNCETKRFRNCRTTRARFVAFNSVTTCDRIRWCHRVDDFIALGTQHRAHAKS